MNSDHYSSLATKAVEFIPGKEGYHCTLHLMLLFVKMAPLDSLISWEVAAVCLPIDPCSVPWKVSQMPDKMAASLVILPKVCQMLSWRNKDRPHSINI